MPAHALVRVAGASGRAALAVVQGKVAVLKDDGLGCPFRVMAAVPTRLPGQPLCTTALAVDDARLIAAVRIARWPGGMSLIGGSLIRLKRPLDRILDAAMQVDRAGMIEHHEVALAFCRPQTAADHLAIQTLLLSRPRQHKAGNIGQVVAFAQHLAVDDDLGVAARQPAQDCIAFDLGRVAVEMLGFDACLVVFGGDVPGMCDVDGKDDRFEAGRMLEPMSDDVADQAEAVFTRSASSETT